MKVSTEVLNALQTYNEDGYVHDGAHRLIGAVYGRLVFAVRRAWRGLPRRAHWVHWARLIQKNPGATEFLLYGPEIFDVADDDMTAVYTCIVTTVQQMEERYRLDKAAGLRHEPFTTLQGEGDDEMQFKCKNCDTVFWSNAYGENVAYYNHAMWPKCPTCGATRTIEIEDQPEALVEKKHLPGFTE